jgi:hypothetical protein
LFLVTERRDAMHNKPDEEEVESHYEEASADGCGIVAALLTLWIVFSPFIFGG